MSGKSFAVGAYVGCKAAGWPFGRLAIADDRITVSCWPVPWFKPRSIMKEAIDEITVTRWGLVPWLKFQDASGAFDRVAIDLSAGSRRVIRELKDRGYPVVDRRLTGPGL